MSCEAGVPSHRMLPWSTGYCSKICGESMYKLATYGKTMEFSAWAQYRRAQERDMITQDVGASFYAMLYCCWYYGFVPQSLCPAEPKNYSSGWRIGMYAASEGTKFKAKNLVRISNYDEAYWFVASGCGSIAVGSKWPESFDGKNSAITRYNPEARSDHIYPIIGYSGVKDDDGRPYLCVANTYQGDTWGVCGIKIMSPSCFNEVMDDPDSVACGITDLAVPMPQRILELWHTSKRQANHETTEACRGGDSPHFCKPSLAPGPLPGQTQGRVDAVEHHNGCDPKLAHPSKGRHRKRDRGTPKA